MLVERPVPNMPTVMAEVLIVGRPKAQTGDGQRELIQEQGSNLPSHGCKQRAQWSDHNHA